jgi:hypothetical protein
MNCLLAVVLLCTLFFQGDTLPTISPGTESSPGTTNSPEITAKIVLSNQISPAANSTSQLKPTSEEIYKQAQYRRIEAAILLLLGIACLGLTVIGLIMLYSIAIRRQVKRDKAEESKMMSGNSLVYLTNNPISLPEMPPQ